MDGTTLGIMTYSLSSAARCLLARQFAAWGLILACGLLLAGPAAATGGLVHAKNFQADARNAAKRKVPVMVLFTTPSCPYCEQVKREYLVPMQKDAAYRARVIIREVTINSTAPLTGFDGSLTTEGAFAAAHKVFMVPTVMVFDTQGNAASEPVVGLLIPDYYFGYLMSAIDEGQRKVRGE
ncbi:MAG: SoxW family protein [Gammaproteobacteria bacterium]